MRHQKIQQPQALPVHRSAAESVADHAPGNGATVSPPPLQFKTNNENEKKASPEAVTQQPDTLQEKELVKKKIQEGNIRVSSLTNIVFFERHPELNKRKLTRNAEDALLRTEWLSIRDNIVKPTVSHNQIEEQEPEIATEEAVNEKTQESTKELTSETEILSKEPKITALSDGAQQVMYELVAHAFAYSTSFSPEQKVILRALGYTDSWTDIIEDQEVAGFFAGMLEPNAEGIAAGRKTIVAFRGSEMGDQFWQDWLFNDADSYAVGYTAFMKNANNIEHFLNNAQTNGRAVVTGHSLGGSLAKQASLLFPDLIDTCITFQAPGINAEQAAEVQQRINNGEHVPRTISHTAQGDIVHLAGNGRIPGQESLHHHPEGFLNGQTPKAHTLHLLSSDKYKKEQDEILNMIPKSIKDKSIKGKSKGKDTEWQRVMFNASGYNERDDNAKNDPIAISVTQDAHPLESTAYETVESLRRGVVSHNIHPNAQIILDCNATEIANMPIIGRQRIMKEFMHQPNIIEIVATSAAIGGGIATLLNGAGGGAVGAGKGYAAEGLEGVIPGALSGATSSGIGAAGIGIKAGVGIGITLAIAATINDWVYTQDAILHILRESNAAEKVEIIHYIGGIGVLADRLSFIYQGDLRNILTATNGYYRGLDAGQTAELITSNLDGGFMGFGNDDQELIIADALLNSNAPEAAVKQVGDGNYDVGLERILRVLQGAEDNRVSARFRFKNIERGWFW